MLHAQTTLEPSISARLIDPLVVDIAIRPVTHEYQLLAGHAAQERQNSGAFRLKIALVVQKTMLWLKQG